MLKVTRIAIVHSLSTVRNADRIYVLDKGQIVQSVTFGQLTERFANSDATQTGLFTRLMAHQQV